MVFVDGAVSPSIVGCRFVRVDGNAVFFSNYVRNATVAQSEFAYTGDNGITMIGSTDRIDGTGGSQPRYSTIVSNLLREIGMYQKQATPIWQSLACASNISRNVVFNTPRAAINFNDGFGGANIAELNLLFNTVRDTSDHGCINYYDRLPYLTEMRNGTPSLTPAYSFTRRNMLFSNYQSIWPSDHDDGSCQWFDEDNFFVYAGFKNYLGNTLVSRRNYYVWPDATFSKGKAPVFPFCASVDGATRTGHGDGHGGRWYGPSGWGHGWYNNTCAMLNGAVTYSWQGCDPNDSEARSPGRLQTGLGDPGMLGVPFTHHNSFHLPAGNTDIAIKCAGHKMGIADFQKLGYEEGSAVHPPASIGQVVGWAQSLFDLLA